MTGMLKGKGSHFKGPLFQYPEARTSGGISGLRDGINWDGSCLVSLTMTNQLNSD